MNAAEAFGLSRHQAERIGRLREALAIVSSYPRADGAFNRDRAACREIAARALERDEREAREFVPTQADYAMAEEMILDAVHVARERSGQRSEFSREICGSCWAPLEFCDCLMEGNA